MKWLADIIRDKDSGHVVARDLFKALAFALGSSLSVAVTVANLVFERKPDNLLGEIILTLFLYSGGLQYLKAKQNSAAGIPPLGASEPPPA